jgi:uncharacterized protein YqeY
MTSLQQRIDDDLKQALREGDKHRLSVLRMLKSAVIYAAVASRPSELTNEDVVKVLRKEAKQRQDSADAYEKAESFDRRDAELSEKAIVEEYRPAQMDEATLEKEVNAVIHELGPLSPQTLGRIIGAAAQRVAGQADGGRVAAMVREKLAKETDS